MIAAVSFPLKVYPAMAIVIALYIVAEVLRGVRKKRDRNQ